jgi:hypothetical protein
MELKCIKSVGKYKVGAMVSTDGMTFEQSHYMYRKVQEGAFIEVHPETKDIKELSIENK